MPASTSAGRAVVPGRKHAVARALKLEEEDGMGAAWRREGRASTTAIREVMGIIVEGGGAR